MAVTFDAHFEGGQSGQASPFSYVSDGGGANVPGTVGAGANRVLIAVVGFDVAASAIAVTFGGASMTQIGSTVAIGTSRLAMFGKIAPASGSQTISVSWTGGTASVSLGAVSVTGADQSTGWANAGSDTGTGTAAASVVTTTSGDMAIAGHLNDNGSSTVINVGTSDWIETGLNENYAQARNPAAGASTTISWTIGSSVAWGNVKVDVIQPGGGGAAAVVAPSSLTIMGVQ